MFQLLDEHRYSYVHTHPLFETTQQGVFSPSNLTPLQYTQGLFSRPTRKSFLEGEAKRKKRQLTDNCTNLTVYRRNFDEAFYLHETIRRNIRFYFMVMSVDHAMQLPYTWLNIKLTW